MIFTATVTIGLKDGMLDPEASAIRDALRNLGFKTNAIRTASVYSITLEAADREEAADQVRQMCERLLANPVIHRYTVEVA